jgi:hypothetical protein
MKFILPILVLSVSVFSSCVKEQEPTPVSNIPAGATAFTDSDIQFIPYTSEDVVFKDQADNILTLNFIERKRSEEYFAWDQTFFDFSTNAELKLEMRLRYLQSDVSKKTLAIYMPYYDDLGVLRNNLFEMPIDYTGIELGFFKNIIEFHDTLVINLVERYKVFEVTELVSTDANKDGPENFNKIFYNRSEGILQINVKDGVIWDLQ